MSEIDGCRVAGPVHDGRRVSCRWRVQVMPVETNRLIAGSVAFAAGSYAERQAPSNKGWERSGTGSTGKPTA